MLWKINSVVGRTSSGGCGRDFAESGIGISESAVGIYKNLKV